MIIESHDDLTRAVQEVMERAPDPRLREIMVSLVEHLHGFIRDVGLTEAEFREACALIAELGPVRAAYQRLDDREVARLLQRGALAARTQAEQYQVQVREAVGLGAV